MGPHLRVGAHTCTCGRDEKTDKLHCQAIAQKYTTLIRCKCLLNKSGCSNECRCKNCANPCGKKEKTIQHTRKRFRHEWQNCTKETSAEFVKNRGEKIETGPFSTLEYFVLVNIIDIGEEQGLDMNAPKTILHIYQQVLTIGDEALNTRTEEDMKKFQKIYQRNLTVFSQMCKNQLQCNLSDII